MDRRQRQPAARPGRARAPSAASRAACSRRSTATRPALQRGVQRRRRAAALPEPRRRRQLPPSPAPQRARLLDRGPPRDAYTPESAPTSTRRAARPSRSPSTICSREFGTLRDRSSPTSTCWRATTTACSSRFRSSMSNRWQMLAGLTLQKHRRLRPQRDLHQGANVPFDFNNPNARSTATTARSSPTCRGPSTLSGSYQAAVAARLRRQVHTPVPATR